MTQQGSRPVNNIFEPLPLGHIRPRGWLLRQLQLQANGLAGHLDECWPDVASSGWIGGRSEGWERGPYWLDGMVPLAFLLDDTHLKAKVHFWINTILARQQQDGWLGPVRDTTYGYEHDPWPVSVVLKAMIQYQGATNDPRIIPALLRFFRCLERELEQKPLRSWAAMRSAELLLSLLWLYERTNEAWLISLAITIQKQGYDWITHFEHFRYTERQDTWQQETHVVNTSMAIKQPGLWYQLSQDEQYRKTAMHMIEILDRYHGQVTGVFSGDEVLAGKNPSQGTELCAVVEYLFSLEVLLPILGEPTLIDRWERIAFNALPAPFKPDMWAHQYDQQVNQVLCMIAEDRIYTTNRADANIFGLEPDFGCCTANMGQGWPKFAAHLWMRSRENGLVVMSYAPCQIKTYLSGCLVSLEVESDYPFRETVQITLECSAPLTFSLQLHIPSWTQGATIQIGNQREVLQQSGWYCLSREWSGSEKLLLHFPMRLQVQTRYHKSVALERGPLVYALRIDEEWKQVRGELPHADWEVYPKSPWNYALEIDPLYPEHHYRVALHEIGTCPFSPEGAPISLHLRGKQVPIWRLEQHAAGQLPESPVSSDQPWEDLTLIPYGCTNLRVTEFPLLR